MIQLLLPEGRHMVIGPCGMCRIPWPGPQGPLKPRGREAQQPPCPRDPHVEPAALAASGGVRLAVTILSLGSAGICSGCQAAAGPRPGKSRRLQEAPTGLCGSRHARISR